MEETSHQKRRSAVMMQTSKERLPEAFELREQPGRACVLPTLLTHPGNRSEQVPGGPAPRVNGYIFRV
jgi:hypothetical protein